LIFFLFFYILNFLFFYIFNSLFFFLNLNFKCPGTPFVLVGTKLDLRDDPETLKNLKENNESSLPFNFGKELSVKSKAFAYCENSAKTQQGLKETFSTIIKAGLSKGQNQNNSVNNPVNKNGGCIFC
jgi:GTPase SAR1 family protein